MAQDVPFEHGHPYGNRENMYDQINDREDMAARREAIHRTAFRLFTEKKIDDVSMTEIAEKSGCGRRTLNRYFDDKPNLVISVAAWSFRKFRGENRKRRPKADFKGMTAAEIFEFFLDSFVEMYRHHRDLLKFNQFFNVYVATEKINSGALQPFKEITEGLRAQFHEVYLLAERDHTLRTDIPEEEIFSASLHLMLAAVTRYAVGLNYTPDKGFDPGKELELQKRMLMKEYCKQVIHTDQKS